MWRIKTVKKYIRLVYTPPDLSARFCKVKLSNTKNPAWFFIVTSLLMGRGVNWRPPRTIGVSNKGAVGGGLGHFVWEEFVFQAKSIVIKGAWLLFLGVHIRQLTRCDICFILGLFTNYFFSKITQSFPQKSYESAPKLTNLWFKSLLFDFDNIFNNRGWVNLYIFKNRWTCRPRGLHRWHRETVTQGN